MSQSCTKKNFFLCVSLSAYCAFHGGLICSIKFRTYKSATQEKLNSTTTAHHKKILQHLFLVHLFILQASHFHYAATISTFALTMRLTITNAKTGGDLLLFKEELEFDRFYYSRDRDNKYFTIAWNRGEKQTVTIDGNDHEFMPDTILPLMFNQTFFFENPTDIVAWQFNREFYCIIDHDAEVSCVGFLFAMNDQLFIRLNDESNQKLKLLLDIFIEELNTKDSIQSDMLIMLLKRLIIVITKRLGKQSSV